MFSDKPRKKSKAESDTEMKEWIEEQINSLIDDIEEVGGKIPWHKIENAYAIKLWQQYGEPYYHAFIQAILNILTPVSLIVPGGKVSDFAFNTTSSIVKKIPLGRHVEPHLSECHILLDNVSPQWSLNTKTIDWLHATCPNVKKVEICIRFSKGSVDNVVGMVNRRRQFIVGQKSHVLYKITRKMYLEAENVGKVSFTVQEHVKRGEKYNWYCTNIGAEGPGSWDQEERIW